MRAADPKTIFVQGLEWLLRWREDQTVMFSDGDHAYGTRGGRRSRHQDDSALVGATGSIGKLVVDEAIRQGHCVRALLRDARKAGQVGSVAQVFVGDVTRAETLSDAVVGIDAIVFTLGSDGGGKIGAERVDYGGVRNVLKALGLRKARIALMTSIGVTNRTGSYNRSTEVDDW
jgi:hypothetical protein